EAHRYRANAAIPDQAEVGENEKCRAPRPPLDLGPGQPDDQRKPGQKERITRSCETRARTGLRLRLDLDRRPWPDTERRPRFAIAPLEWNRDWGTPPLLTIRSAAPGLGGRARYLCV